MSGEEFNPQQIQQVLALARTLGLTQSAEPLPVIELKLNFNFEGLSNFLTEDLSSAIATFLKAKATKLLTDCSLAKDNFSFQKEQLLNAQRHQAAMQKQANKQMTKARIASEKNKQKTVT